MAGRLQSSTISAPGFLGVNTQESSVDLASGYALEAYNCVIDKFGRGRDILDFEYALRS